MDKANKMVRSETEEGQAVEPWIVERAREVLRATGRLHEFQASDINPDELRELVGNVQHSRRMREAGLSITRENSSGSAGAGRGMIWDEVMK